MSQQNFAQAPTALLSMLVQNFVVIQAIYKQIMTYKTFQDVRIWGEKSCVRQVPYWWLHHEVRGFIVVIQL